MRNRRNESGFVLIMTVLVLSILVVLAYALSYSAGVYDSTARNARAALQRECAVQSALNYGAALLGPRASSPTPPPDTLNDPWAALGLSAQIGGELVYIGIVDENRKLNVNLAARRPPDQTVDDLRRALNSLHRPLNNLVTAAGGDHRDFDAICAWVDPSELGEHDDLAPKAPLPTAAALRRIPGLTPELFRRDFGKPSLPDLLSTHPEQINLNTALPQVLDALWEDTGITKDILDRQARLPFKDDTDAQTFVLQNSNSARLNSGSALRPVLSARSDYFTVTATPAGRPDEGLTALVQRSATGTQVLYVTRN